MRFTEQETALLLLLLHNKDNSYYDLLLNKLQQNEYIKGRLLHQLYDALLDAQVVFNDERDTMLVSLLKRIKFKATPR
ncbi:hypothetical protein K5I29_05750 [Flavobacterium agricola]|uniref:Uncharacterized protein n=1 Tax=Flavobacterium agricola TaxID=2870839 RepID=A0ABY6M490_9FLAO|nr:hypothetical protein [Flavobacterium agricola]UYW02398.1 hypothetical protein K5I29_05750 [Flavobacterium agricola]